MSAKPTKLLHLMWGSACLLLVAIIAYLAVGRPTEADLIKMDFECLCTNATDIQNRPGLNLAQRQRLLSDYFSTMVNSKSRAGRGLYALLHRPNLKVNGNFLNQFFAFAGGNLSYCEALEALFPAEAPEMYARYRYSDTLTMVYPQNFIPCP